MQFENILHIKCYPKQQVREKKVVYNSLRTPDLGKQAEIWCLNSLQFVSELPTGQLFWPGLNLQAKPG